MSQRPDIHDCAPIQARDRTGSAAIILGLSAVLLAGAVLRWAFLWVSHPHVDEYSSIWAAMHILQKGLPVLPSGFWYLQGVLFTYVDAAFIGLLGSSEISARLPSFLSSILTLVVLYVWGRRSFGAWAALLAVSIAALESASIVWGGRARMYALQQMLVVLALYAFSRGYIEETTTDGENSRCAPGAAPSAQRWRWAFAACFVGAVLSQTVTILIAPALVIALFVWRGRWAGQRTVWLPLWVSGLSVLGAVLLNRLGGPVSDAVGREFLDPALPWRVKPEFFFREFFWAWPDAVRTALFVAGFVLLVVWSAQAVLAPRLLLTREGRATRSALLYLYLVAGATLLPMVFLVGESWQRPRYLTMILPVLDLLAAAVLWRIGRPIMRRTGTVVGRVLALLTWLALLAAFLPAAWATIGPAEPAYDQAFRYVQTHWQEGDRVISPLPSIAGVYLGRCDGYALQDGYEEYLLNDVDPQNDTEVDPRSSRVDRWTGAPLIDSVATFKRYFPGNERVWFVVDDTRWDAQGQRYTPEFKDYVTQNMPVTYQSLYVTVYQRPRLASQTQ